MWSDEASSFVGGSCNYHEETATGFIRQRRPLLWSSIWVASFFRSSGFDCWKRQLCLSEEAALVVGGGSSFCCQRTQIHPLWVVEASFVEGRHLWSLEGDSLRLWSSEGTSLAIGGGSFICRRRQLQASIIGGGGFIRWRQRKLHPLEDTALFVGGDSFGYCEEAASGFRCQMQLQASVVGGGSSFYCRRRWLYSLDAAASGCGHQR